MRITTIPFSFSLAAGIEGYQVTQPLPLPFRIIHLEASAEPNPSMLLFVQFYKWAGGNPPAAGAPSGITIFDKDILNSRVRLGRVPIDMDLDIKVEDQAVILCYCNNRSAAQQQAQVDLTVALP